MSLQLRLSDLITAIGADIKTLRVADGTDQVLTTTYTNATITGSDVFTGFAPAASSVYLVSVRASVLAAAVTTGVQVALAGPTTGITNAAVKIVSASAASTDLISHSGLNAFQAAAAGLTTASMLFLDALVETTTVVGTGNIRLQARSEVAGSTVSILRGSTFNWRKVV